MAQNGRDGRAPEGPLPNELAPTLLDRLMGRQGGIGPNRGSEQTTTDRKPIGGQHEMRTADQDAIMQDFARVSTPGGFTGPRGKYDPSYPGVKEVQAAGVPPVLAPWEPYKILPKDAAIPKVPYQVERYGDVTTSTNSGRLLDRSAAFPWHTLQIDNYSRIWLYVPAADRYVPPFVWGVQFPIYAAANKVEIDAIAPPNFTQPAANTADIFTVTCYEAMREYSPGIPIQNQGGAPSGAPAQIVAGTHTPADATANPTDAIDTEAFNMVWNGTTWDRVVEALGTTGNIPTTGIPEVGIAYANGTTNMRALGSPNLVGTSGASTQQVPAIAGYVYNGTTFDAMLGGRTGATGAVATTAAAPTAANMLDGFANVQATTTTTLVTVPTGRTWVGYVGTSCASSVAAGGAAATVSSVITTANGTGTPTPVAGTYARTDITIAAVGAALSSVADTASISGQRLIVQAAGGTCLIQHVGTIVNGTGPQASGWAIGELM